MIFQKIAEWFSRRKRNDERHPLDYINNKYGEPVATPAPTPTPEPTKCGCGRSPTGLCVGLHKLTTEEWANHADNPNRVVKVEPPVAAVPTAVNDQITDSVTQVPAKKPRKPAAKKKSVEDKPVSKKPANDSKKVKKAVEVAVKPSRNKSTKTAKSRSSQ